MSETSTKLAFNNIIRIAITAYIMSSKLSLLLILKGANLCLKYGIPRNAPAFYAGYGMILCIFGETDEAFKFGELALKLTDTSDEKEFHDVVVTIFCNYIGFLKRPLRHLLKYI
jgi:predicted ATPase